MKPARKTHRNGFFRTTSLQTENKIWMNTAVMATSSKSVMMGFKKLRIKISAKRPSHSKSMDVPPECIDLSITVGFHSDFGMGISSDHRNGFSIVAGIFSGLQHSHFFGTQRSVNVCFAYNRFIAVFDSYDDLLVDYPMILPGYAGLRIDRSFPALSHFPAYHSLPASLPRKCRFFCGFSRPEPLSPILSEAFAAT